MENSHKHRIKVYPHTSVGKIVYAPEAKGICDKTWVIVECDKSIIEYYSWFLQKKGVKLEFPMWGSHISVIRGEIKDINNFPKWNYLNGKNITFNYGDLVTNGNHWWLEVFSSDLEQFRTYLDLPSHPPSGFHLTIGKINHLN